MYLRVWCPLKLRRLGFGVAHLAFSTAHKHLGVATAFRTTWLARHRLYALPRYTECKATLRDDGLYRSGHGVGANSVARLKLELKAVARKYFASHQLQFGWETWRKFNIERLLRKGFMVEGGALWCQKAQTAFLRRWHDDWLYAKLQGPIEERVRAFVMRSRGELTAMAFMQWSGVLGENSRKQRLMQRAIAMFIDAASARAVRAVVRSPRFVDTGCPQRVP